MSTTKQSGKLDVYIITWNIGTKAPDNVALEGLLGLEKLPQNDKHQPDLYLIGLQEVSSQPQNLLVNLFKSDPWTRKFKNVLKPRDYVVIKTENLQGLLLIVFAKRKHILHLRDIEPEFTRTGLAGLWGNKGGISVRFDAYRSSICVVNCHLAAHDHKLNERIQDYHQILNDHKYHVDRTTNIFSHDYVFWFGDLNFRIDEDFQLSPEEIRAIIEQDKLAQLIRNDQLVKVMHEKRAFENLTERVPQFPPTFKFEEGTSKYDMKRRPAWCDRILYAVNPGGRNRNSQTRKLGIEQTSYKSHPLYSISDHKPVTSEISIRIDTEVKEVTVTFAPIALWKVGEDTTVQVMLPPGFEESDKDWVGVFKENYTALDRYKAYEYTNRDEDERVRTRSQQRTIRVVFPGSVDLKPSRKYRLLYFKTTGFRGVSSVVGISDSFPIERRSSSPAIDEFD